MGRDKFGFLRRLIREALGPALPATNPLSPNGQMAPVNGSTGPSPYALFALGGNWCEATEQTRYGSFSEAAHAWQKALEDSAARVVAKCDHCQGWHLVQAQRKILGSTPGCSLLLPRQGLNPAQVHNPISKTTYA